MKILYKNYKGDFTTWTKDSGDMYQDLEKQFNDLGYKTELYCDIESENSNHINFYELIIDEDIRVLKYNYDDYITFWSNDIGNLKYVHGFRLEEYNKDIPVPNKVKVLSKRVVDNWIKYRREEYKQAKELSNKREMTVKEFIKTFTSIKGAKIKLAKDTYNGTLSGEIDGQYLRYTFSVDNNSGYITQNAEFRTYVGNNESLKLFREIENL